MTGSDAIVTIQGLSKEFPGVKALSNVDFTLKRGEIHGLMGENGAGKSTLLRSISGLMKINKGSIFYKDKDIEQS